MKAPTKAGVTWAICLAGIAFTGWMALSQQERATDFNQFYSAGKLAGTGELYNWDRMQELERPHQTELVPFGRIPFYAAVFKGLTALPYGVARIVWAAANAAALLLFALLWPAARRADALMTVCWFLPAALLLSLGQDTALFLLSATVSLRLLQSDRDFAAGATLSLCAAKFHLALGIPVFLAARRRWGAIAGGLAGGIVQLAVSFAAEGWGWPARLVHLASISRFSPAEAKMPNLLGLTYWIPHGTAVEAILSLSALTAVWVISRRGTLAAGVTAALTAGLLVGHHSYVYDAVLLLPAVMLVKELCVSSLFDYWSLLLCTPVPYLLMMIDRTAPIGQIPIAAFGLAALILLVNRESADNYRPISAEGHDSSLQTV